ncbi:MAG TPA: plastocyanin/azurin family copper-binding protein [Gemmatimonadales bacterium]|jgi:plastocyanin
MVGANGSKGTIAILLLGVALAACSSDSGGDLGVGGPGSSALSAARSAPSGDGQSGTAGQDLANPLRIVVMRGSAPEAGAVVTWNASGTGSAMKPSVDTTGADGISTSIWHLGNEVGSQSAEAGVTGADGSPVGFSATATTPGGQGDGGGGGGGGNAVQIELHTDGGNRFQPANVTIPAGTTVRWTWVSGFHDVSSGGNPAFDGSGQPVSAPHTFSHTFSTPGTYVYFCSVHGSPTSGMRGTIIVQ